MAIPLSLAKLSSRTLALIEDKCAIKSRKTPYGDSKALFCYSVDHESSIIYVAMGMWRTFCKNFPWTKDDYPIVNNRFLGKLFTKETDLEKGYRDQVDVSMQLLEKLNKDHYAFLSAATGFGKCFHPDQKLILQSRALKRVGDIVPGDLLLGDDWLPREVTSTIVGQGEMYELLVYPLDSPESTAPVPPIKVLTCNADHILCLTKGFSSSDIIEISLADYLLLPETSQRALKLYSMPTGHPNRHPCFRALAATLASKLAPLTPTNFSEWAILDFHYYVRAIFRQVSDRDRSFPLDQLPASTLESFMEAARRAGIMVLLEQNRGWIRPENVHTFEVKSLGIGTYAGFTVSGTNQRFFSDTGIITHNTTIGCYLAVKSGLKTVVMCHLTKVREQWVTALSTKTNGKVQLVTSNFIDPQADYYVMGPMRAARLPREALAAIGFVIIDEAHLTAHATFEQALLRLSPLWIQGLSATPRRADGLHTALEIYFGPRAEFTIRREKKPFTVYKIETNFIPDIRKIPRQGKMIIDWSRALKSLANNPERHKFIADRLVQVLQDPDEYILVLTLRIVEGVAVANLLREALAAGRWVLGPDDQPVIEVFSKSKEGIGGIKSVDRDGIERKFSKTPEDTPRYRVQIFGMKKGGVGYDDPTRTSGVLLDSVKDVEQYEGRVRMVDSTIYDFVDDFGTLETHWSLREKYFLSKGATIVEEPASKPRTTIKGKFKRGAQVFVPDSRGW